MTKENWEKIKTMETIPLETWFEFYKERGGYIQDIREFSSIFLDMMTMVPVFRTAVKRITQESAKRNLFEYYNAKFG